MTVPAAPKQTGELTSESLRRAFGIDILRETRLVASEIIRYEMDSDGRPINPFYVNLVREILAAKFAPTLVEDVPIQVTRYQKSEEADAVVLECKKGPHNYRLTAKAENWQLDPNVMLTLEYFPHERLAQMHGISTEPKVLLQLNKDNTGHLSLRHQD